MQDLPLLLTLTGGLAAALLLGYITHRLGLSPIVGSTANASGSGPTSPAAPRQAREP